MAKKYGFSALACFAVYWLSNSLLWLPWKYAAWLGAVCMLIYVPIAWGGVSLLSLTKFSAAQRRRSKYWLGAIYVAIAVLSDFVFYVLYRKVPDELFKPATFGAYLLCFAAPVVVGFILQKREGIEEKRIATFEWMVAALLAALFVALTFYVVRFW